MVYAKLLRLEHGYVIRTSQIEIGKSDLMLFFLCKRFYL